jgi:hypothetical protein
MRRSSALRVACDCMNRRWQGAYSSDRAAGWRQLEVDAPSCNRSSKTPLGRDFRIDSFAPHSQARENTQPCVYASVPKAQGVEKHHSEGFTDVCKRREYAWIP